VDVVCIDESFGEAVVAVSSHGRYDDGGGGGGAVMVRVSGDGSRFVVGAPEWWWEYRREEEGDREIVLDASVLFRWFLVL